MREVALRPHVWRAPPPWGEWVVGLKHDDGRWSNIWHVPTWERALDQANWLAGQVGRLG